MKNGHGISFGTGSRPPLNNVESLSPGPGAYPLKSTLSKNIVSQIESPPQISLASRHKFGDPYIKALSKETANEPGPGHYGLNGKFLKGSNSERYSFPKNPAPSTKTQYAPGPGAYETYPGIGRQFLSTKISPEATFIPSAKRSGLYSESTSDIGPGDYGPPSAACEDQLDSRKKTCKKTKFGTGYQRMKQNLPKVDLNEPYPGPGSYVIPGQVGGQSQIFRNAPKTSLSGRNSFGSPWTTS
eukprot:CAMPEP_0182427526 /NCGR_PEP_ID=MMETSP1167-20130531/18165_1 /TAXON_ID=2988 /ORGANISM="Mallomonas Sp, Strain CCMP3275" /LENGTH=241 /DNA_ID=CAMNT_0024609831 /DNA_START=115 /DNA_END=843 /DNA_ORIENTATION=-